MEWNPFLLVYQLLQWILIRVFSPNPPKPNTTLVRPKIAVIGAGLTGVSAASHVVGHGFDVHIFEAGDERSLGGIWSRVNNTSGLQIHSIMYRFHPSVEWKGGYPDRHQIVSQIRELWKRYGLQDKTSFNTRVQKVYQDDQGRWIINNPSNGRFDGVIPAIGTCGEPNMPAVEDRSGFHGELYHSSNLTGKSAEGKNVVIIGGGASAVEALEFAIHTKANSTTVLARSEKWIIPRNALVDMMLAFNIWGQETMLSWIPELLLRKLFYRDLEDISPPKGPGGLFTETPMVNSDIMKQIRQGNAQWLRGDVMRLTRKGVLFNYRSKGIPKGGPGQEKQVEADLIIMATGYHRPSLGFLPREVFLEPYQPPAWYLQVFPPSHISICANNCTYTNAIGSVGNWHVGIYTRLLLVFLVDPLARPQERGMKLWINLTQAIKSKAPTKAFDFFTYSELVYWFLFVIAINPFRWKWAPFVFFGLGASLPLSVVKHEDTLRNGLGWKTIKIS